MFAKQIEDTNISHRAVISFNEIGGEHVDNCSFVNIATILGLEESKP